MSEYKLWVISRRSLLFIATPLTIGGFQASGAGQPWETYWWPMNGSGDAVLEQVQDTYDPIESRTGHAKWVGSGLNRALRFDGYSVWIDHRCNRSARCWSAISVTLWVALEAHPVHDMAFWQWEASKDALKTGGSSSIRFGLDKWGFPFCGFSTGDVRQVYKASQPITRAQWVHLAVTIGQSGELTMFCDGLECGSMKLNQWPLNASRNAEVIIGKSTDAPVIGDIFPTGVVNGLLKDLRVYDTELSSSEVMELSGATKPFGQPNLEINGDWCSSDKQRPVYHALPPRAWTNEPHGLIRFDGNFHIFYQKNGNGPYWGNINWGHMTSPDLYSWKEMSVALSPEPGPDNSGCWSGSALVHNDEITILYTGGDGHHGHRASICMASSTDGVNFTKYRHNPIIPAPPPGKEFPEFRDPFIWQEGNIFYLIVGSAVKGVGGTALLYRSKNLKSWEFLKPILVGSNASSGTFWEMPNFKQVGNYHVLTVCEVPGRSSYWVGTWKDETFTPLHTEPRRLDLFNHLLSPTPYTDEEGNVITMGIIPEQRSPQECWGAGWAHLYSLPRVLSTDSDGNLRQKPLARVREFGDVVLDLPRLTVRQGEPVEVAEAAGTCMHLRGVLSRGNSQAVSISLRRSPNGIEETEIRYDWIENKLSLDRRKSSLDPLVKRDLEVVAYSPEHKDSIAFEIFLDNSVLEVFLDERAAFATRIYPTLNISDRFALSAFGGAAGVHDFKASRMRKIERPV